jgi:hypothetical protein
LSRAESLTTAKRGRRTERKNNRTTFTPLKRVRKIAKSDYELRRVCRAVRPSVWSNSASTGQIFTKFDILVFFENYRENSSLIKI